MGAPNVIKLRKKGKVNENGSKSFSTEQELSDIYISLIISKIKKIVEWLMLATPRLSYKRVGIVTSFHPFRRPCREA